jgi:hypothetical protein
MRTTAGIHPQLIFVTFQTLALHGVRRHTTSMMPGPGAPTRWSTVQWRMILLEDLMVTASPAVPGLKVTAMDRAQQRDWFGPVAAKYVLSAGG